jgi:leader peptidase (prepilin peptidase) / N-methyltransferase
VEVAVWYAIVFGWLFVVGCAVGSFLNVCVYRLPRHKNLLWPSSRCGFCFTPIPLYHNVPLLSYWLLRGRCIKCRARFSMRYFWAEFLTGASFALLYLLEVGFNVQRYPNWHDGGFAYLESGVFPPHSWPLVVGHGVLLSLLLVASACLLDGEEVPPGLVVAGAVLGSVWAILFPWPAPAPAAHAGELPNGFVPWPVWHPTPSDGVPLGLLTALAGLLLVPGLVRLVGALHRRWRGHAGLTPAAALLTMTGGFLGWQPLLVAVAVACALLPLGILLRQRVRSVFSLVLAVALVVTWLGWGWLGPLLRPYLFDPWLAALAAAAVAALLFGIGFVLPDHSPSRRLSRSCISSSAAGVQA